MGYRVDNMPWPLRPFFWIYGYGGGFLFFLVICFLRVTCRVEYRGEENLEKSKNHIFCCWHDEVWPCLVIMMGRWKGASIINHPAWYMKHIHVTLFLSGLKRMHLGSTGFGGREAANRVVEDLRNGWSSWLNPDGPYGPLRKLKKGVLHMSAQSGVPVAAMQIKASKKFVFKSTWDGKQLPYPFCKIVVDFKEPVWVTAENFDESYEKISKLLG